MGEYLRESKKCVSSYADTSIILTTKHHKAVALASTFEEILGAHVIEHVVDTDQLGTFSGELERKGSALEAAKQKCEWGLRETQSDYGLASEGSFGPHPLFPLACLSQEILYFMDKKRQFHLHVKHLTVETNYQMKEVCNLQELSQFAASALFPSHALIVRAFPRDPKGLLFKGIQNQSELEEAFLQVQKSSRDHRVWVETDMRAHLNPTRMGQIRLLGKELALRLKASCPKCQAPGWGKISVEFGLPCSLCGRATERIKAEVLGCVKCPCAAVAAPSHGLEAADPAECLYCNP